MAWSAATVLWAPAYAVAILAQNSSRRRPPVAKAPGWRPQPVVHPPVRLAVVELAQLALLDPDLNRSAHNIVSENSPKIPELHSD